MTRQALGVCKQGHAKYHRHGGLEIHPMVLISHKPLAHCGIGRCFYVVVSFHPSWSWHSIKKKWFLTTDENLSGVHIAFMSVAWCGRFWNSIPPLPFLPLSLTWQKESCVFLILRKFWGLSFILRGWGLDPGINLAALILMLMFQVGLKNHESMFFYWAAMLKSEINCFTMLPN